MENDKEIKSIIKRALEEIRQEEGVEAKGRCLTDLEICSLIDGKVPKELRDVFIDHILSCKKCAKELKEDLAIAENVGKDTTETPEEWIQDAIKLVGQKPPYQPESIQPQKELVTSMPFADQRYLFERGSPLTIRNFKVVYASLVSRKRRGEPLRTISRICFTVNYSCYTYLFLIKKERVNIVVQNQQFPMNTKNELLIKTKKPLIISKKGGVVLVFSRELFKNISSVKKLLLNTCGFGARKVGNMLREIMKDEDIVVKFL